MIRAAFPDAVFEFHHLLMEGDLVVGHWTMQATHQGEMLGIPATGRPVTMNGMDLTRWNEGKLVEIWHVEEVLNMLQQVGAVPSPGPT
jgi:predicted ester cyclase